MQQKFRQAAAVYRLGKIDLKREADDAVGLIDGAIQFDLAGCSLPWMQLQQRLQSIRAELQPLTGLHAQQVTTEKMQIFFRELIQRSMIILGAPPMMEVKTESYEGEREVPYAFLSMGSMSFSGMSLYSDLEFVILVEKETPEVIGYFTKLTQILEMLTLFLGETPPRGFSDDARFQRGLAFDEMGNTPLGFGQDRQGQVRMPQSADLNIKTPADMARMIPPNQGLIGNLIISHALCSANLAFGDPKLFATFLKERRNRFGSCRPNLLLLQVYSRSSLFFPCPLQSMVN